MALLDYGQTGGVMLAYAAPDIRRVLEDGRKRESKPPAPKISNSKFPLANNRPTGQSM